MPAGAWWEGGDRLQRRLLDLSETMKASSSERKKLEQDTEKVVRDGVQEALLAGQDEAGREFAPLAKSTLEQRQERGIVGTTPFITKGPSSSIITQFRNRWETSGTARILLSWWDLDWLKYHWDGGRRLPRRRPGIPPKVIERVRALHSQFAAMLRQKLNA